MGRDRDEYRDVKPEKAWDHGNDPNAVRTNRESSGRDRDAGREGHGRAASGARQTTRVHRAGAADASQGTLQHQQQTQQLSAA